MERNDCRLTDNRTPFKRKDSQQDLLAQLSSCFQVAEKENGLSSADKRAEDGGSLESDKHYHRFGTPMSMVDKNNQYSPRKTTCDKNRQLAESPGYFLAVKGSSAKRVQRFAQTPVSIFEDSNEKRADQLDFRPLTSLNQQDQPNIKGKFILPELERQTFTLEVFDNPLMFAKRIEVYDKTPNVFMTNIDSHSNYTFSRESRTRAEPGKCNCRNSQCLKMYCDCLKRGDFCSGCNCIGCENHSESEIRKRRVGTMLDKAKKVVGGQVISGTEDLRLRVMRNGCNCRKNYCLKKYCECHQFGLKCSRACRCLTCQNGRDEAERTQDE